MYQKINALAAMLEPEIIRHRRNLHRIPELAWEERKTTAYIENALKSYGFETLLGEPVTGHDTGVLGFLDLGPGPEIVLRFDIDGLPIEESNSQDHIPEKNDFLSQHPGRMHACGHDGHAAIGLGCAALLSNIKDQLSGKIRLLFQPAEEGCKGAAALLQKGWLDTADYFLAGHIVDASQYPPCDLIPGVHNSLATTKLDVSFTGKPAHGSLPEQGASVISAIAAAVQGINGIPRNSQGATFANIGVIHAGSGRNVIPEHGRMELETRGATTELNAYMEEQVINILHHAAAMWNCSCDIQILGRAPSLESTPALCELLKVLCRNHLPAIHCAEKTDVFPYSEDAAALMERVKSHGGQACYLLLPSKLDAPLHTPDYDFQENILSQAAVVYAAAVYTITNPKE